jgi:hypothetical protein
VLKIFLRVQQTGRACESKEQRARGTGLFANRPEKEKRSEQDKMFSLFGRTFSAGMNLWIPQLSPLKSPHKIPAAGLPVRRRVIAEPYRSSAETRGGGGV